MTTGKKPTDKGPDRPTPSKPKKEKKPPDLFKKFVEESSEGLGWIDLEGHILFANRSLARLIGAEEPDEIIGTSAFHCYDEQAQWRLRSEILPAVLEKGSWSGELNLRNRKSDTIPTQNCLFVIRDQQGNPTCIANIVTDLTSQRNAEEALEQNRHFLEKRVAERTADLKTLNDELNREMRERANAEKEIENQKALLESVILQSPVPMVLVSVPDMKIRIYNQACKEILGVLDEPDYAGQSLFEFEQSWQDLTLDDKPVPLDRMPLALALQGIPTQKKEMKIRQKDGTIRYEMVDGVPIYDRQGNLIAGFIVFPDITDRKLAEQALEKRVLALTLPMDHAGDIEFSDLFNIDEIQQIQELFAKATGVASIITHPDGTPITRASNFCRLCSQVIRKTEKGLCNCYKSDSVVGRFNPSGPIVQPCLSGGLWDAGASISAGGSHIANWLIGQVRNEAQSEERMLEYAREIGADENEFLEAYREVPIMSQEQFNLVADTLFAWANHLSTVAYQNLQQARFISERKVAEEKLRKSQADMAEAQRIAHFGSWEWDVKTGDIRWSDEVYRIFGLDKNFKPRIDSILALSPPEERDQGQRLIERAVQNHEPGSFEQTFYRPDGSMGAYFSTFEGNYDEEGNLVRIFGVAHDITADRQAEQALQESEARYRTLVENAPEAIVVLDLDTGKFVDSNKNAELLYGLSRQELMQVGPADLSPPTQPDGRPSSEAAMAYVMAALEGEIPFFEWTHLNRKTGREALCEIRLVRLPSSDRKLVRGSVIDITEQKRAEEELNRFFTVSLDLLCIADTDGFFRRLNPQWEKILGYKLSDLEGQRFLDFVHPDDQKATLEAVALLSDQKEVLNFTNRYRCKDGSYRWIEWRSSPSENLIYAAARDITDRVAAEHLIRAQRDLVYNITQAGGLTQTLEVCLEAAMAIADMDAGGIYLIDEQTGDLNLAAFHRLSPEFIQAASRYDADSEHARIVMAGDPVYLDFRQIQSLLRENQSLEGLRTLAVVPVRNDDRIIACINVASHLQDGISQPVRTALESLTSQIGSAIDRARARQLLAESEKRYRLVAENATDVIWSSDMSLKMTYVSPSVIRLRGYTVEEAMEQSLNQTLAPSSAERAARTLAEEIEREKAGGADPSRSRIMELEYLRKDGSTVWVEATVSFLRDAGGQAFGILGISRDISERKRSDEVQRMNDLRRDAMLGLNELAARSWNEITDYALEAIVRITESQIGYIAFLNDSEDVLTMYSWSKTAMEECRIQDKPIVYPLENTGLWGEAVRQRRPVVTNDYGEKNPLKKGYPEGHVDVKRHLNLPIFDQEKIVAVIGVGNKSGPYDQEDVNQITLLSNYMWSVIKNRKAEEALRKSEEQYRFLAENASDVIWTRDMALNLTYISPSVNRVGGFSVEEMANLPIEKTMTPRSLQTSMEILSEELALENGRDRVPHRSRILEHEMYHKDGSTVWVETTVSFIRNEEGVPMGMLGISRDITERKKAEAEKEVLEEQLRQSQKMEAIGRLAGGVAHDFNNIMTGIIGYSEMLLHGIEPGDPLRVDIEEIRRAGERAASLTNQLLAFSRKQVIAPRIIRPNEIVERSEKMLQRIIGEDIDLMFIPGKNLGRIKADPAQLDQVLVNLAVNARDAMPTGGRLTIETQNTTIDESYCKIHREAQPGEYVMLAVSDSGHGMDENTIEKIFEPFFTTKDKDRGTGLGLATVYGIVKQNNGFINVYSEPNIGSSFKIFFPRVYDEAESLSLSTLDQQPRGSETILLVEDEDMVRGLARRILERQGYTVIEASNGGNAYLECVKYEGTIHLLLTDVVMPTMNGRELFEKLRELKPDLRALFMSGYTENVIAHHGVLETGTQFIQKPFTIESLARKVRDVLDDKSGSS